MFHKITKSLEMQLCMYYNDIELLHYGKDDCKMVDNYITEVREELNCLVSQENAELHNGEILTLSEKLDKLIFVKETIVIKRSKINFIEQLHDLLCPTLYDKIVLCY
jgi:hypothetical protein